MDIVVLDNMSTVCPVGHYCPIGKSTPALISYRDKLLATANCSHSYKQAESRLPQAL